MPGSRSRNDFHLLDTPLIKSKYIQSNRLFLGRFERVYVMNFSTSCTNFSLRVPRLWIIQEIHCLYCIFPSESSNQPIFCWLFVVFFAVNMFRVLPFFSEFIATCEWRFAFQTVYPRIAPIIQVSKHQESEITCPYSTH